MFKCVKGVLCFVFVGELFLFWTKKTETTCALVAGKKKKGTVNQQNPSAI